MSRPEHSELHSLLKDLVRWEVFALHLPSISQADIDKIKQEQSSLDDRKLALFDKWLRKYPAASWNAVMLALEKTDEMTIAQSIKEKKCSSTILTYNQETEEKIQMDVVKKLDELHQAFATLSFESKMAFKEQAMSGKITLNELILRAKEEKAYNLLDELNNVNNIDSFLDVTSKHCHFLKIHLLRTLVSQFLNPSDILQRLETYAMQIEDFKRCSKIRSLSNTLYKKLKVNPRFTCTVLVENVHGWEEHEMWLVETLLQTLCLNTCTRETFRVIPDCT